MKPTELQREVRKMRFTEVYEDWQESRLTQEEAAKILGRVPKDTLGTRPRCKR